jgi:hypothetical protein
MGCDRLTVWLGLFPSLPSTRLRPPGSGVPAPQLGQAWPPPQPVRFSPSHLRVCIASHVPTHIESLHSLVRHIPRCIPLLGATTFTLPSLSDPPTLVSPHFATFWHRPIPQARLEHCAPAARAERTRTYGGLTTPDWPPRRIVICLSSSTSLSRLVSPPSNISTSTSHLLLYTSS